MAKAKRIAPLGSHQREALEYAAECGYLPVCAANRPVVDALVRRDLVVVDEAARARLTDAGRAALAALGKRVA